VIARRFMIAIVVAGLALAGCSSSSKPSSSNTVPTVASVTAPLSRPKVTIIAKDFSFLMPSQIPSGYVDITLQNQGKADHQAQFVNLGSMTLDEFKADAVKTDIGAVKPGTIFVGGPNDAASNKATTATVKLDPGSYAVVCFIPGADGKPHAAQGMISQVQVVKMATSVETAPTAASTIILGDFSFTLPAGFTGKGLVEVSNQGTEVHELNLFKLAPGVTEAQAKTALLAQGPPPAGPPPFTEIVGTTGLTPQQHAWLSMNLAPGNYLLVCFFPDPKKGNIPHILEGMIKEFTIS
jgi:hypothetical protein